MKVKKIATFLLAVCSTVCCTFAVGSFSYSAKATGTNGAASQNAQAIVTVESFLNEVYKVGDAVELPAISGADRILYDPDGNGYVKDNVQFAKAGTWKLVYESEITTKTYEFTVYPSLSTINGTKSKVYVGKAADYVENRDAQGRSGIVTQVAYNESVTFNQVIDFTDKTRKDTVLEFSVLPETYGVEDASILVLTFTDIEDPENTMQVHLRAESYAYDSWLQRVVYIRCGGQGQRGTALEKSTSGFYQFENSSYFLRSGDYSDMWGAHTIFSMRSVGVGTSENKVGHQVFGLSMDYAEKRLFCYTRNNGDSEGPHLLNDFDDPDIYGDNLWNGFTSGKCRLTISAQKYVSNTFTMLITKLGDQTEFQNDYITNDESAKITVVDTDMNKVPYIVKNKAFTIPKAIAYDAFGNALKVNTNVYVAYNTGAQASVDIKSGSFTPTQLREYTLVYSCQDQWGNTTEAVYPLKVISEAAHIPFTVSVDSTEEIVSVGQKAEIKLPKIAENYIGNFNLEITARLGGESISLASYKADDSIDTVYFTPMKAGDWIIAYKYSDAFTSGLVYYNLIVTPNGDSYFISEAAVPKYVILGASCDTPPLYGYDFSGSEGAWEKAKLYVTSTENIEGASEVDGESIVWTENVDYVYYTYVLCGTQKQYKIPVVDVGYKTATHNAVSYFHGYTGTPVVTDEATTYTVAEREGKYMLGFANKLQTYNLRFDLRIPETADYTKVNAYITDVENPENVLMMSYSVGENGTVYYSVNNGTQKPISGLEKGDTFSFRYAASTNSVTFITTQEEVLTNLAGEKWTGFATNMVWLEWELECVDGADTSIIVEGINNQRFYKAETFDLLDMAPEFYQDIGSISPINSLNTKITVPTVYVADVFAVGTKVTLQAYAPDGSYVTAVDGTVLDGTVTGLTTYEVLLKDYGMYDFKYSITDDLGRVNKRGTFQISVADTQAPNVVIQAHANTAKIGETFKAADITLTDDISAMADCTYSIYVECPDYTMVSMTVQGETPFIFTQAGTYTVWYFANDKAGNSTLASYEIYVS